MIPTNRVQTSVSIHYQIIWRFLLFQRMMKKMSSLLHKWELQGLCRIFLNPENSFLLSEIADYFTLKSFFMSSEDVDWPVQVWVSSANTDLLLHKPLAQETLKEKPRCSLVSSIPVSDSTSWSDNYRGESPGSAAFLPDIMFLMTVLQQNV